MKPKEPTTEELLAQLNAPLPHSVEAEEGIIGAILHDPRHLALARLRLMNEAFHLGRCRDMWIELLTMEENSIPIDAVTLTGRLREAGKLDHCGGPGKVTELGCLMPSPAHFKFWLEDVENKWKARRAIEGYARALAMVQGINRDENIASVIASSSTVAQSFLDSVTATVATTAYLSDCLTEHAEHMTVLTERVMSGNDPLIKTGIPTLDKNCGGIGKDEYWLVTGPTKSGKSVLTGNIAVNAALRGHKVKIFSNEVGRRTYAGRIVAMQADDMDGTIERKGLVDRRSQETYAKAVTQVQRSIGRLVKIDNSAGRFVEDIVADIRNEAEQGCELVIVDLIGKVRSRQRWETREREIAHISLSLYEATKRYNVAIIAVAQENEDGQIRESRSPAMDCEAWLKVNYVNAEKQKGRFSKETSSEILQDRRNLIVELARGFAAGDRIPMLFNGKKFTMREITHDDDWTEQV